METGKEAEVPFSARYSLPAHLSENLGEVSWDALADMSSDFQTRATHSDSKVKKIIKDAVREACKHSKKLSRRG